MIVTHHDLQVEVMDEWLTKSEALNFVPCCSSYVVDTQKFVNRNVCIVAIKDVAPVRRAIGIPTLKSDDFHGLSAEDRCISLLKAMVAAKPLPPIELKPTQIGKQEFELKDGTHRLYLSLALGFTHVPAVRWLDIEALDRGINHFDLC
jgi:hypothetical protein